MMMALKFRASAATSSPPLPPPAHKPCSSSSFATPNISPKNINHVVKLNNSQSLSLISTSTSVCLFNSLFTLPPHDAKALTLPKEQIVSSLNQVESTIDQFQEVGSNVFNAAGQLFGYVFEAVKPGIDVALPFAKQVGEQAAKVASPALSEASKIAQEAIQSTGFDTQPVVTAAKTVADVAQQTTKVIGDAKPIATSTMETISSSGPVAILEAGGALFLAYLLLPPVFSAISFSLRGYKGDLSPAQTLDLMSSKNYFLIDIRSEKDKDKAGIPSLPSSTKNQMIAIPLEELPNKLKSIVKNAKKVEAELVALKISYLKKISKGSNIVILDTYTDSAKTVARLLTSLGFKNIWIVSDGFSGSKGWSRSSLGTDSYKLSVSLVLSPSRIIPAATRRFGTTSSAKLLPGSSD